MNEVKLYEFIKTINSLKNVYRSVRVDGTRHESSAEHSWSLVLMVWLLASKFCDEFNTNIDLLRLMKMVSMHDLVEIYAGDVNVWDKSPHPDKAANEQAAAERLFGSLPHTLCEEFLTLWQEYEAAYTLEAKIAKGVDRISPTIQRIVSGQGWDEVHATTKDVDSLVLPRTEFSQTLLWLYGEIKREAITLGLIKERR